MLLLHFLHRLLLGDLRKHGGPMRGEKGSREYSAVAYLIEVASSIPLAVSGAGRVQWLQSQTSVGLLLEYVPEECLHMLLYCSMTEHALEQGLHLLLYCSMTEHALEQGLHLLLYCSMTEHALEQGLHLLY
jgi:hypothetical protein